jgi:EmrB/QacA subfamily drug resistance transporter
MQTATRTSPPGQAPMDPEAVQARRWLILGILCLSLVLVVVANTALNVALPTLVREVHATSTQLQWITDAYALVFAGLLLPAGALGDRFGRKGALQLGLSVVGISALLSTFATSADQLIATRALMGLGAAFVMPATLSILANVFPPQERARAIAIWAGFAGAAGAIGPVVSGLLLEHFKWNSVFFVNVPTVVVALLGGYLFVPTSSDPSHGKLDPLGALLSMAGLGALLFAIIQAPVDGWGSPSTVAAFVVSAVAITAFILWELHTPTPMLPMEFFKNRRFSIGSATITLTFFTMFGLFFILTLYLQFVLGYSPVIAGVSTFPLGVMMIIVAPRSAGFVVRWGQHRVQAVGLLLVASGLLVLTQLTPSSNYLVVAVGLALMGTGVACTTAPATNAIIGSVPLAKSGVGSAVNDTTREVGGALGIAVLGSVMSSAFRSSMAGKVTNLPADVAPIAQDSVGGSFEVSKGLGAAGQALRDTASLAFTDAMHTTLFLGVGVAVLAAAMVYFLFPRGDAPAWGGAQGEVDARGSADAEGSADARTSLDPDPA